MMTTNIGDNDSVMNVITMMKDQHWCSDGPCYDVCCYDRNRRCKKSTAYDCGKPTKCMPLSCEKTAVNIHIWHLVPATRKQQILRQHYH